MIIDVKEERNVLSSFTTIIIYLYLYIYIYIYKREYLIKNASNFISLNFEAKWVNTFNFKTM